MQLTPPSRPAAAAATPPVPALPAWAALLNLTSPNRSALRTYNARLVAAANASSITYDIAFYGDSLTGLTVLIPDNAMVWGAHFGAASGLRAARLGLGGSTVEELAWRLAAGGEKPARDPLVSCSRQQRQRGAVCCY